MIIEIESLDAETYLATTDHLERPGVQVSAVYTKDAPIEFIIRDLNTLRGRPK
jgi:hypothetical protein